MQHFVSERNRIGGSRSFCLLRECSFVVWYIVAYVRYSDCGNSEAAQFGLLLRVFGGVREVRYVARERGGFGRFMRCVGVVLLYCASLHASAILTTGIARPPGPDCGCVFSEAAEYAACCAGREDAGAEGRNGYGTKKAQVFGSTDTCAFSISLRIRRRRMQTLTACVFLPRFRSLR